MSGNGERVTGNGRLLSGFGLPQIHHLDRAGDSRRGRWLLEGIRGFQVVLDEQVEEIPLVEDLAVDVGVVLPQQPDLSVLLGDELLVHRRYLDEHVLVGKIEVRSEPAGGLAVSVELDREGLWLVLPGDPVEVEESGELPLAVVGEFDEVGRGLEVDGQLMPPGSRVPARPLLGDRGRAGGCRLRAPAAPDPPQCRTRPAPGGRRRPLRRHCVPRKSSNRRTAV